jgi:hypothetical protein
MQIIPNAKAQFIDQNGLPLASGTVGFYFPGTLNPKPTYQDAAGTIANTNPVALDSRGQALIWGSGVYRQIVKDASGVTIWDQVTEDSNAGLTGNITDAKFVSGTDFIPGTTNSLTLPVAPASVSNMWVHFDAAYQADDQIASLAGTVLTFNNPIPVGVQEVNIKIGTTIAIGTPGAGTVTDASVALGTKLFNRLNDFIDLRDKGCKCDGVTDDTAALQMAVTSIGSTGATLIIPGPTLISGNITFGANTVLWPLNGGYLVGKVGTEVVTVQQTPFAGPIALFKTCAPIATRAMTVFPEWFGAAQADTSTDSGVAITAAYAFLKNTLGVIRLQGGSYYHKTTIVALGGITLEGAGQNNTKLINNASTATVDGIHCYGTSAAPITCAMFRDFSMYCSTPSTGSFGVDIQYCTFAKLENMQIGDYLYGFHQLQSPNAILRNTIMTYQGTTPGFIGYVLDGGTAAPGNQSSVYDHCWYQGPLNISAAAAVGSIGFRFNGVYMSDMEFINPQGTQTAYGMNFDFSTAQYAEDILVQNPVLDQFNVQGILVNNLPAAGVLTIIGGWINPITTSAGTQTWDIYLSSCLGAVTINGIELVADANTPRSTGIYAQNCSALVVTGGCQIKNHNIGVNLVSCSFSQISGNHFRNDTTAATFFISGTGDARSMVTANTFTGNANTGVGFDTTSSSSGVVANTFDVLHIATRVSNNSTSGGGIPVGGTDGSTGLNSGF